MTGATVPEQRAEQSRNKERNLSAGTMETRSGDKANKVKQRAETRDGSTGATKLARCNSEPELDTEPESDQSAGG